MNCTTYQVSNIRPLPGEVLLEILEPTMTAGGIHLSQTYLRDPGDEPRMPDHPQSHEAIVRKINPRDGKEIGFVIGDRVLVDRRSGHRIHQAPRALKLVPVDKVLAVFQ